jgi:hypothetical protein
VERGREMIKKTLLLCLLLLAICLPVSAEHKFGGNYTWVYSDERANYWVSEDDMYLNSLYREYTYTFVAEYGEDGKNWYKDKMEGVLEYNSYYNTDYSNVNYTVYHIRIKPDYMTFFISYFKDYDINGNLINHFSAEAFGINWEKFIPESIVGRTGVKSMQMYLAKHGNKYKV